MLKKITLIIVIFLSIWGGYTYTQYQSPNDWIDLIQINSKINPLSNAFKELSIKYKFLPNGLIKVQRADFHKTVAQLSLKSLLDDNKVIWPQKPPSFKDFFAKQTNQTASIRDLELIFETFTNVSGAWLNVHPQMKQNYLYIYFESDISMHKIHSTILRLLKNNIHNDKQTILITGFLSHGNRFTIKPNLSDELTHKYLTLEHTIIRALSPSISDSKLYIDIQHNNVKQIPSVTINIADCLIKDKSSLTQYQHLKDLTSNALHEQSIHNFYIHLKVVPHKWHLDNKIYRRSKNIQRFSARMFSLGLFCFFGFCVILIFRNWRIRQRQIRVNNLNDASEKIDLENDNKSTEPITIHSKVEVLEYINEHFSSYVDHESLIDEVNHAKYQYIEPSKSCQICPNPYTNFLLKGKYLHCPKCFSVYTQNHENTLFLVDGPAFRRLAYINLLFVIFNLVYYNIVCFLYQTLTPNMFDLCSPFFSTALIIVCGNFFLYLYRFNILQIIIPKQKDVSTFHLNLLFEVVLAIFIVLFPLANLGVTFGRF